MQVMLAILKTVLAVHFEHKVAILRGTILYTISTWMSRCIDHEIGSRPNECILGSRPMACIFGSTPIVLNTWL